MFLNFPIIHFHIHIQTALWLYHHFNNDIFFQLFRFLRSHVYLHRRGLIQLFRRDEVLILISYIEIQIADNFFYKRLGTQHLYFVIYTLRRSD